MLKADQSFLFDLILSHHLLQYCNSLCVIDYLQSKKVYFYYFTKNDSEIVLFIKLNTNNFFGVRPQNTFFVFDYLSFINFTENYE